VSSIRTTSLGTGAITIAFADAPAYAASRAAARVHAGVPGRYQRAIPLAEKPAAFAVRSADNVL